MLAKGTVNNYKVVDSLGSGDCGDVWKARNLKSGALVALKVFKSRVQTYDTEVRALQMVSHPRVIRLLDQGENAEARSETGDLDKVAYITMELMPRGELYLYVKKAAQMRGNEALSESATRLYAKQLLEAVNACHQAGVVHRDVKLDNLLLDQDWQLVLTDFGLAATSSVETLRTIGGRTPSVSPELLRGEVYNGKLSDVFACGYVIFCMRTGRPPFEIARHDNCKYRNLQTAPTKFWNYWRQKLENPGLFSKGFTEFFMRVMAHDPHCRVSAEEALRDPWLQGRTATTQELRAEMEMLAEHTEG